MEEAAGDAFCGPQSEGWKLVLSIPEKTAVTKLIRLRLGMLPNVTLSSHSVPWHSPDSGWC